LLQRKRNINTPKPNLFNSFGNLQQWQGYVTGYHNEERGDNGTNQKATCKRLNAPAISQKEGKYT
jgi:hypothetical protein